MMIAQNDDMNPRFANLCAGLPAPLARLLTTMTDAELDVMSQLTVEQRVIVLTRLAAKIEAEDKKRERQAEKERLAAEKAQQRENLSQAFEMFGLKGVKGATAKTGRTQRPHVKHKNVVDFFSELCLQVSKAQALQQTLDVELSFEGYNDERPRIRRLCQLLIYIHTGCKVSGQAADKKATEFKRQFNISDDIELINRLCGLINDVINDWNND